MLAILTSPSKAAVRAGFTPAQLQQLNQIYVSHTTPFDRFAFSFNQFIGDVISNVDSRAALDDIDGNWIEFKLQWDFPEELYWTTLRIMRENGYDPGLSRW